MRRLVIGAGFAILALLYTAVPARAALYPRAPDTLPGTIPEMRDPAFWIARMAEPDAVILTPAKIAAMNEAYRRLTASPDPFDGIPSADRPNLDYWWPGIVITVPDLAALSPAAVADTVRNRIGDQIAYLRSKPFGNALAVEYAGHDIDRFEREMARDQVPDAVTIRTAVTVRAARLANVPSFFPLEPGITDTAKTRWDLWSVGCLDIARPLTVMHRSRSGEYLFVLCEIGYGWMRATDAAFTDEAGLRRFTDPASFVVCCGERVLYYGDQACDTAAGWFGMGSRLPLASSGGPHAVAVPVRRMDGSLAVETAWLTPDADVSVGWLPYTRRNIVVTAFKLLDQPYDWSGAWFGRQHETTYRDIFACFGFTLPYHGAMFPFFGADGTRLLPSAGKAEQYRVILAHEPFVTVQTCGTHCQLFLGEVKGEPIVFDQHGYGYTDADGVMREVRRTVIGDLRMPDYFLKGTITFLVLK